MLPTLKIHPIQTYPAFADFPSLSPVISAPFLFAMAGKKGPLTPLPALCKSGRPACAAFDCGTLLDIGVRYLFKTRGLCFSSLTMSGQKSILSFLKPAAGKRPIHKSGNTKEPAAFEPQTKKVKLDDNDGKDSPKTERVAKEWPNEIIAKIKLRSRTCPALHPSIGHSWFRALEPEFKQPYFQKLSQFLVQERAKSRVFPPEDKVWTWTQMCEISEVKVVILGQDPYHNPGQAHGLCFSVPEGVPPPPSLLNMYSELENDIPGFERPNHGCLTGWAEQGVLLLNACLTVRCNAANSHKDQGWEQLTDAVIRTLSNRGHGLVFLLWGSYAQKKAASVDKKKHHLLKAPHPSPLSAHRGFFGCKHFSECNRLLKQAGKKPIDWSFLPLPGSHPKSPPRTPKSTPAFLVSCPSAPKSTQSGQSVAAEKLSLSPSSTPSEQAAKPADMNGLSETEDAENVTELTPPSS